MKPIFLISPLVLVVACAPDPGYTPPEDAGLIAVRPYPGPADVCQVIGENDLTNAYLDHTATLVGCPSIETGAIKDRVAEGGAVVDKVGDWVLISIPTGS